MDEESEIEEERELEFEDIDLSDTESTSEETTVDPISIDYNSRIASTNQSNARSENEEYYENISNVTRFQPTTGDTPGDTDCEDIDMSDDDLPTSKFVNMQNVIMDGMSCFASKYHSEATSTYNHSSTNYKDNADFGSCNERSIIGSEGSYEEPRRLSFGLSLANSRSIKDGISVNRSNLSSFNIANSYSDSIFLQKRSSTSLDCANTSSSLMTCLEFLKSDLSEDDGTDVEEIAFDDLGDIQENEDEIKDRSERVCNGRNVAGDRGDTNFFDIQNRRKSSLTTELLLDDSDDADDADLFQTQRSHKRLSIAGEYMNDCPTDEEDIDLMDLREWTETDESGDVRQITHIKTETSIKLEGDDAVKSLKKTPPRTPSDAERKSSTESEQEDLSFKDKKSFFQRLSLTSEETLPTTDKWIQDVSLDDLPMAEGEIIVEHISFEDKMNIFEPNRVRIQKRDRQEQQTVYHYDFTKSPKKSKKKPKREPINRTDSFENSVNHHYPDFPDFKLGPVSREDQLSNSSDESDDQVEVTPDKEVEQEVSTLIAEVDKEERKLTKDIWSSGIIGEHAYERKESLFHEVEDKVPSQECKSDDANDLWGKDCSKLETEGEEDIERSTEAKPPSEAFEDNFVEGETGSGFDKKQNEDLKSDEDDDNRAGESKVRPSKLSDISSVVDSHIKSEILQEEIDQSIEESPLEVKHIADELEEIASVSGDHKRDVYEQIRTEIFTQELGEVIESGSPERKELGAFSSEKREPSSDPEFEEHENSEPVASTFQKETGASDTEVHKRISPQASVESCGYTDDISSESAAVEPDEQLFDYEEAKAEHSLTEQLQALATNSLNSSKTLMAESKLSEFRASEPDYLTSGMSSSLSDLEVHRRSKEIAFARQEKKEIRSLKSTKQVSTIEEHSSIESCESPQELLLHDLPEKYDPKDDYDSKLTSSEADYSSHAEGPTDSLRKSSPEDNDKSVPNLPLCSDNGGGSRQQSDSLDRHSSRKSGGKKSDSDAEGGSKRKEESSSSGETESPYYSVETSDSGWTPRITPAASRPTSSEFDVNVFSGQGSEYETCVTSQEASGEGSGSYATAISSQEISYATACSSFSHSSRESAYSVDSESSGHLASVEVSSEASETLVPSAQEMELEFGAESEMPVLDEEPPEDGDDDESVREPYDTDIPESIIRGGIEMPFMKSWDMGDPAEGDDTTKQLPQQWMWQSASDEPAQKDQGAFSKPKSPQAGSSAPHGGGPSHRRSFSSVVDIVPDRELLEQSVTSLDEEQLSVSESSATHSEQTWQTSSIDTALQLSSQAAAAASAEPADALQETPPDKELTPEPSSYLQLNGPVEVDYNPDFDNPEGDSELMSSNQNQAAAAAPLEVEGLQFDLEMEGNLAMNLDNENSEDDEGLEADEDVGNAIDDNFESNNVTDNFAVGNVPAAPEYDSHSNDSAIDAEKPEAQQEQSLGFCDYSEQQPESESRVCSDFASYLPESEQCDLLPGGAVESLPPSFESEMNIPIAGSASSNEGIGSNLLSDLASTDSPGEKGETVDTSPEDERYEYKGTKSSAQPIRPADVSPTTTESDVLNPESEYASPGAADLLYTHQEEEEFDMRHTYLSPIPSVEDEKSTPSSDAFHSKRFFPRSSADTSAASSLQEFERLEAEIAAGRISRASVGSYERAATKEPDDVSIASLTEFEKLEKECAAAAENNQEAAAADPIMMLSEIEEGLESQCSDALEVLQEESSEYERRRRDFEEVIKVAQCNVEKFQEETFSEGVTSDECTVVLRADEELLTDDRDDSNSSGGGDKDVGGGKLDCMLSSTDSMEPSSSTATHATYQFETDSVMSSSLNSAQASGGEECTIVSSTDTLEPENKLTYSQGASHDETVVHSSKGALEYKLKELQSTNGAKQQMEMFLSKLTDQSGDEVPAYSGMSEDPDPFSAPDDLLESIQQAAHGVSSSGDGAAFDGDDLVSTTTRVVTSVITDPDDDSTFVQRVSDDGIRQSCEITFSEVVNDSSSKPGESGGEE